MVGPPSWPMFWGSGGGGGEGPARAAEGRGRQAAIAKVELQKAHEEHEDRTR